MRSPGGHRHGCMICSHHWVHTSWSSSYSSGWIRYCSLHQKVQQLSQTCNWRPLVPFDRPSTQHGKSRYKPLVIVLGLGTSQLGFGHKSRARRLFFNNNAVHSKTIDAGYDRRAVRIHARNLNHDSPSIIPMIRVNLMLVQLFRIDVGCVLSALLQSRQGKKEADSQRIYHGQTGSGRSMNPSCGGIIQCVRRLVRWSPLCRVQCLQISL